VIVYSNTILLFPEKSKKRLFCFAEDLGTQTFREAEPRGFGGLPPKKTNNALIVSVIVYSNNTLLFLAFVLLRRRLRDPNLPRSGTTGVWGLAPKNNQYCIVSVIVYSNNTLLFPEKEAKSVCSASQKT
jgi:hypothetical protein